MGPRPSANPSWFRSRGRRTRCGLDRINEPEADLPPLPDQIDRFLVKLVGVKG
jgi:hypothetical protein